MVAKLMQLAAMAVVAIGCSGAERVETSSLASVSIGLSFCGRALDQCQGTGFKTANFSTKQLTVSTCVEHGAGMPTSNDVQTRAMTDDELAQVRTAVSKLTYAEADLTAFDGRMESVTIDDGTKQLSMSPQATCGPSPFKQIKSGFSDVSAAFGALTIEGQ